MDRKEVFPMATRGRKPTPTAIKELEGNPGKRKLNENEPKPERKAPACPKWLDKDARKEWHRLAKKMEALGIQKRDFSLQYVLTNTGGNCMILAG